MSERKRYLTRVRIYLFSMSVAIIEGFLMSNMELETNAYFEDYMLLLKFLLILFGTYFCFFVKPKLSTNYDQIKLAFTQMVFCEYI